MSMTTFEIYNILSNGLHILVLKCTTYHIEYFPIVRKKIRTIVSFKKNNQSHLQAMKRLCLLVGKFQNPSVPRRRLYFSFAQQVYVLPTLILLVSSLLVYHYSSPSLPAPAGAIASTVFTRAGR